MKYLSSKVLLIGFLMTLVALGSGTYVVFLFQNYERGASRMLSGQESGILAGQTLQAKLEATKEFANISDSERGKANLVQKLGEISRDVKAFKAETSLRETEATLDALDQELTEFTGKVKGEPVEDLFLIFRNIRATAFSLYRLCWNFKMMMVAKNLSLVIQDLDQIPPQGLDNMGSVLAPKIHAIEGLLSGPGVNQEARVAVQSQLNQFKSFVGRYSDVVAHAERVRRQRVVQIDKWVDAIKSLNGNLSKRTLDFASRSQTTGMKALFIWLSGAFSFSVFGLWALHSTLSRHEADRKRLSDLIRRHGKNTIMTPLIPSSQMQSSGRSDDPVQLPQMWEHKALMEEWERTLDQQRNAHFVDLAVRDGLPVAYIVVDRKKQVIFCSREAVKNFRLQSWEKGMPLSSVVKVPGSINKLHFDLIENRSHEFGVRELDLLVGSESIPFLIKTGFMRQKDVQGANQIDEAEGVFLITFLNLREEKQRLDSELEVQLRSLGQALTAFGQGTPWGISPEGLRAQVVEMLKRLKGLETRIHDERAVLAQQLLLAKDRLEKEGELKSSFFASVRSLNQEIESVSSGLSGMREKRSQLSHLGQGLDRDASALGDLIVNIEQSWGSLRKTSGRSLELMERSLQRLKRAQELNSVLKERDDMVRSVLDKTSLITANHSILLSRKDLSPEHVQGVLGEMGFLADQFEKGYRFLHQTVAEIDSEFRSLQRDIAQYLTQARSLAGDDSGLGIHTKELMEGASSLSKEAGAVRGAVDSIESQVSLFCGALDQMVNQSRRMVSLGQASLQLHDQMAKEFPEVADPNGGQPLAS